MQNMPSKEIDWDSVDWRIVAYHEAAHAVIADALGGPARRLTATGSPFGTPGCEFDWPDWNTATIDDIHDVAKRAIAGPLAEYNLTGEYNWDGWEIDRKALEGCYITLSLAGVAPRTFEDFWQETQEAIAPLLKKHWPAASKVAAEVIRCRQKTNLDGGRLKELIAEAHQRVAE